MIFSYPISFVAWRKRRLIIGLSTVVAAIVAILQLVGWAPWK